MLQILFLVSGVMLLYSYFKEEKLAKESLQWPHVEGQIHAIKHAPIGNAVTAIVYSYSVDGKQYESKKAFFGSPTGTKYKKSLNEKFHENDKVEVYYKPENPQIATLITGFVPGYKDALYMGIGAILLFLMSFTAR